MKVSTPSLAESALLKYLYKLFKVKGTVECGEAEAALAYITGADDVYTPEGLDEDCSLIYERGNLRAALWGLTASSALGQLAYEIGGEEGRGYFLTSDSTMIGADALFLCAVSINETESEAREDVSYIINSWMRSGCPKITIAGCMDKKHGGNLYIVAAQLSSLI